MATLAYSRPSVFLGESAVSFPRRDASAGTGHTGTAIIQTADIVVLSAGVLSRAATNAATNIGGYAISSELATFGGSAATWTPDLYDNLMFGFSQVGTILPPNPGQIPTIPFTVGSNNGVYLDINVSQVTGWISGGTYQANIGTTGGLTLDTGSNMYIFDPSQSNKILTIYFKPTGPFLGGVGDLGSRVRCYFNAGTV